MKKAAFFDFDGTLANTEKLSVLATQQAFKQIKLPVPDAQDIVHYQGVPIETSFSKLGAKDLNPSELQTLYTNFRAAYQSGESADTITAFPGIVAALAQLKIAGVELFIMTSKKSAVAQRNLAILNINQYFSDIYGSDRVVAFKPLPGGLLQAMSEHHIDDRQAIMIGDATFDIDAGNAAGIDTIAVTWGSHDQAILEKAQPNYIISDAKQLTEIIIHE